MGGLDPASFIALDGCLKGGRDGIGSTLPKYLRAKLRTCACRFEAQTKEGRIEATRP